jgi:hypothetical protein
MHPEPYSYSGIKIFLKKTGQIIGNEGAITIKVLSKSKAMIIQP